MKRSISSIIREKPVPKLLAVCITLLMFGINAGPVKCKSINNTIEHIDHTIKKFVNKEEFSNTFNVFFLKCKILFNSLVYGVTFEEYFLFNFASLNSHGKKSFVGGVEHARICNALGTKVTRDLFFDKWLSYLKFKDYYNREIIAVKSEKDKLRFIDFLTRHKKIVVKPISSSFGKGIYLLENKGKADWETLFFEILKDGELILEELVYQHDELAAFHCQSVNTVRMATYYDGCQVVYLFSFLRMGMGDSFVDNAGRGGVFASVDVETGVVKTSGVTEDGREFLIHPDSGKQIIGFQIPRWNALLALVEKAALTVKEQPYVGWDLALRKDGAWCIIEGNCRGRFVHQICENKGCRHLVNKYFCCRKDKDVSK